MLTDVTYRPVFLHFWKLKIVPVIIVGLTGTLPPQLMQRFFEATDVDWKVVRTPSVRPELRPSIKRVPQGDMVSAIAVDVQQSVASYGPNDRAMIFCRTKNDAEKMARALNLPVCHSGIAKEDNDQAVSNWKMGRNKVMVSTSLLGSGLDYPAVRDVIHLDVAHTMLDQHQEESRGGRDGLSCNVVTYVPTIRSHPLPVAFDNVFGAQELQDWSMQEHECLRIAPSVFLDGPATPCILLPGCAICAVCERQASESPSESALLPMPPRMVNRDPPLPLEEFVCFF